MLIRQVCEYSLVVGSVDKVPATVVEGVEELEAVYLVHGTHTSSCPLVTNAHGTELKGRDIDACIWREATEASELSDWLGCRSPKRHVR